MDGEIGDRENEINDSAPGQELVSELDNNQSASAYDKIVLEERAGLVTARGTSDGLVLRLDARVASESLKAALTDFVTPRKGFLLGNDLALEWVGGEPLASLVDEIREYLAATYKISIKSSALAKPNLKTETVTPATQSYTPLKNKIEKLAVVPKGIEESAGRKRSLFDGISGRGERDAVTSEQSALGSGDVKGAGFDLSAWDDADARILYGTMRSGQRIETEHSIVVVGDVNPGAEIVAGGDIIVLGALRGIAHAGAYDETGGGRMIFALNLQPTQLRIGTTISRGSTENRKVPEIAKVEGNIIVVEPFQPRSHWFQRLS